MRWLLFFVAVSASADCTSRVLYNTADSVTNAVIDQGGLYVSLQSAGDIERIDLASGARSIVLSQPASAWDVQNGYLATSATIGRTESDVKRITVRNGTVYWLEADRTLRRMLLGGGATEILAERVADYAVFEDRLVYVSDGALFFRRLTETAPTVISPRTDLTTRSSSRRRTFSDSMKEAQRFCGCRGPETSWRRFTRRR